MKATLSKDGKVLTLEMPVREEESQSGKMLLIASSHGFMPLGIEYDGKPVSGSINIGVRK